MIVLLQLLWSFTKIGFTSFGGLSMVPLISSEMLGHGWMNVAEVADIVAIAEMTPGPLGLNCATFAGIKTAGILGAIMANLGILMPTITVTMIAAIFLEKFKNSKFMQNVMFGIRPACVGMIIGLCVTMSNINYVENGSVYLPYVIIGLIDIYLLLKVKISIPKLIIVNALVGLILFGIFGL